MDLLLLEFDAFDFSVQTFQLGAAGSDFVFKFCDFKLIGYLKYTEKFIAFFYKLIVFYLNIGYKSLGERRNRPGVGTNKRIGRKWLKVPVTPIAAAKQYKKAQKQSKTVIFQSSKKFFHDTQDRLT